MTADPLTDIVTLLQPEARFSKLVEGAGNWRIHRASAAEPFYCAVLDGEARIRFGGAEPVLLRAGDFVLAPAVTELVSQSADAPADLAPMTPVMIKDGHFRIGRPEGPADTRMQIGHCRFGAPDAALLVSLLPAAVVVRGAPRLATLMSLLSEETRAYRPARELVLQRLLEVLLIEAFRSGSATSNAPGLSRGLADERLSAALRALHARPGHAWTVTELASEAALSRSAFFARFSRTVGLAPMEYLLTWRMALAKQLLRDGSLSVQAVAERVGYGSASAFTVAFSRHAGLPPARFARLNQHGPATEADPPGMMDPAE